MLRSWQTLFRASRSVGWSRTGLRAPHFGMVQYSKLMLSTKQKGRLEKKGKNEVFISHYFTSQRRWNLPTSGSGYGVKIEIILIKESLGSIQSKIHAISVMISRDERKQIFFTDLSNPSGFLQ